MVGSRLDYANSLLFGTTQKNISRLQRVQNTLAGVVVGHALPQGTHSSTILHQCINSNLPQSLTTLNSSQPAYLRSLLSHHTPAHSLCSSTTNLSSVLRVHTAFACTVSVLLPPQYGTHSLLSSAFVLHQTFFLKSHCFDQAFSSPQRLTKCLRFGPWSTLCTIKDFIYLLTYLPASNTLVQLIALFTDPESHNAQRYIQTDRRTNGCQ